jgi:hypothetical protein
MHLTFIPPAHFSIFIVQRGRTFAPNQTNFDIAWLNPQFVAKQPTWTNKDWSYELFEKNAPVSANSTFTISPTQFIVDTHSGLGLPPNLQLMLSLAGFAATVEITLQQTYESPPGIALENCSIVRSIKFNGPNNPPTLTIKKTGP